MYHLESSDSRYHVRQMKLERRARFVTVVPPIAAIAIVVFLWHRPWDFLRVLGLVLLIVGFTFLTIARINLGNAFSVRPRATSLVTSGLYSRVRNPIYVFGAIAIAGILLYIDRPIFLLLLLPLIVMQVWRARAEARVLEARFGEEYRRYRAQTWF
jgi:protein-S-isoprenylcysteine O-methyltransferase Ste14